MSPSRVVHTAIHSTSNHLSDADARLRRRIDGSGSSMWIVDRASSPRGLSSDAPRRASSPRRSRCSPTWRRGIGRWRRRCRTGACRTASPEPATARRSATSSTTRCASARRSPGGWAAIRPGTSPSASAIFEWGEDRRAALNAAFAEDRHAPAQLPEEAIAALGARDLADAPDHVRADIPEWLAPHFATALWRGLGRGRRCACRAAAARSPRQHAEGRPRKRWRGGSPASAPCRRPIRRSGCASPPMRRRAPASERAEPTRPSSAGGSRCRTREASSCASRRRQARRTGARPLRRRRRQDAGARRAHGKPRPGLRPRHRPQVASRRSSSG